ncbi:MAG: aminotransferase class I/II-fold pyridoxal phosphate-dependent enzyme [Bacteroidetes bacterium]|nr:aminotransferase class I/II-fold pyridoxal phosphate-dependent enzyme [Bacteroidota bacterium]
MPKSGRSYHVGRPNIGDRRRLMERINDILDRRWLTNNGPYVREFEERIAELVGVKHCVVVCNGTVGLEIAIRALGLEGEVILPAYTFVATAHALQWQQITPVFCDIDPETCTIDPHRVEELITPRTSGIMGVHLWGRPCAVEALSDIADRHGLRLLFDAAHAFGCSHNGQMVGGFGDAEVFSFHATKFVNAFEGGAIVTNSDELARKIRLMKNFGFVADDDVRHIGTNGKMAEISAAMGLTSLESMDHFMEINYRNYQMYGQELDGLPGIRLAAYDESERCNYQYIVIEVDEEVAGTSREELRGLLRANRVRARRYFYPGCHRMEPYKTLFPDAGTRLPYTEAAGDCVIVLPTGTAVDGDDIRMICGIIRDGLDDAAGNQKRRTRQSTRT